MALLIGGLSAFAQTAPGGGIWAQGVPDAGASIGLLSLGLLGIAYLGRKLK